MSPVRLLLCIYCVVFGAGVSLMAAPSSVTDSLQGRLAHTSDPRERVQLLLNLKDLNEDTHLNLPYSIQLFREAADIRDTYAMSVSVIPILSRYSIYVEKEDTLRYYVQTLRDLTPGTPEEGADAYAEMCIGFYRLGHQYDLAENLRLAHEVYDWSNTPPEEPENIYQTPAPARLRQPHALLPRGRKPAGLYPADRHVARSLRADGANAEPQYPQVLRQHHLLRAKRRLQPKLPLRRTGRAHQ